MFLGVPLRVLEHILQAKVGNAVCEDVGWIIPCSGELVLGTSPGSQSYGSLSQAIGCKAVIREACPEYISPYMWLGVIRKWVTFVSFRRFLCFKKKV